MENKEYSMDACPLCGGHFKPSNTPKLSMCDTCGVYKNNSAWPAHMIKENCSAQMLGACKDEEKFNDRMRDADWQLQKIEKYMHMPGRLYDVGAAGGFFMYLAHERGWKVAGNEISVKAISWAKEKFGLDIDYGFFEEATRMYPAGKHDAVVMWNTLEHTVNPRITIETAQRMLRQGGLLWINVPHKIGSQLDRYFEQGHTWEFNEDSIKFIEDIGFEELERFPITSREPFELRVMYRKK